MATNNELYLVTKDQLTGIADAVRERTGGTEGIAFENLETSIREDIVPVLQEKTVSPSTSSQSVAPDDGYDGLSKVTVNAMPAATQATPTISVSSAGLITASSTQSAGYVSVGTKSSTKQLTTQAAKTVTPSTSEQTAVASGRYTTGAVTVAGDANLKAENIKKGISIFGVAGSYEGSGGSGSGREIMEAEGDCTYTFELMYEPGVNAFLITCQDIPVNIENCFYFELSIVYTFSNSYIDRYTVYNYNDDSLSNINGTGLIESVRSAVGNEVVVTTAKSNLTINSMTWKCAYIN